LIMETDIEIVVSLEDFQSFLNSVESLALMAKDKKASDKELNSLSESVRADCAILSKMVMESA